VHGGTIYLRCADLALAIEELRARGVTFSLGPHLIARMDDHDLWMAFFLDPDGNSLALMQEAPKGYSPVADRTLDRVIAGVRRGHQVLDF
jgi:methylmalonyl-CoA/ethylmalonyl-CoA epimerase